LYPFKLDLDTKMWEVFGREAPVYPNFSIGVPFDVHESWESTKPLAPNQTFLAGYPVRPEFLVPAPTAEELATQRAQRGLEEGEQVVLVMTGGGGQSVPWPTLLANSKIWADCLIRVVVVAGANVSLAAELSKQLKPHPSRTHRAQPLLRGSNPLVTVEVARDPSLNDPKKPFFVGGAEMAALMDLAGAAITKPGGGSTAELAYRGVPAVLDATKGAMHWEAFSIKSLEAAGRGVALRNPAALEDVLLQALRCGRDTSFASDHAGCLLSTRDAARRQAAVLSGIAFS
jgi:UDP-N-acetylglucosamine:LPS N-acetylglucosamine transferase